MTTQMLGIRTMNITFVIEVSTLSCVDSYIINIKVGWELRRFIRIPRPLATHSKIHQQIHRLIRHAVSKSEYLLIVNKPDQYSFFPTYRKEMEITGEIWPDISMGDGCIVITCFCVMQGCIGHIWLVPKARNS